MYKDESPRLLQWHRVRRSKLHITEDGDLCAIKVPQTPIQLLYAGLCNGKQDTRELQRTVGKGKGCSRELDDPVVEC